MEAYHVINTHPQVAVSNGDANSQYDVYGEHVDRFISTLGVLSPHLYGKHTEEDILEQFTLGDSGALGDTTRTLGEGGTARQVMADMFRGMFEKATNTDLSGVSDSELLDCFSYTVFPNTFLFPGISLPMVYRFRPDPRDHRMCIYEVLFLRPVPVDGKRPEPAEPIHLGDQQSFTEAEGMDPGLRRDPRSGHGQSVPAAGRPRGQRQARAHARQLSGNSRPALREDGRQIPRDGAEGPRRDFR